MNYLCDYIIDNNFVCIALFTSIITEGFAHVDRTAVNKPKPSKKENILGINERNLGRSHSVKDSLPPETVRHTGMCRP